MVKLRLVTKASELSQKIHAVTRKCVELSQSFPFFSWEFFTSNGKTYFTASYRSGDDSSKFEFPVNSENLENCGYILDQLNELKWSALFYEKEEEHG